ncbi:MAG: diacylglycerol kinase catalytic domain-containing protein [Planctomycetota bacterium]
MTARCWATGANRRNVRERIYGWLAGVLTPTPLPRMRVTVNDKPIKWPVLNEVLLSDHNPAAMTRYRIKVRRREEEHRGSGLWVATGPGSTGAIRSAGGRILPMRSKQIQFLARELYPSLRGKAKLSRGVVGAGGFEVRCLTRNGALFCDGSRRKVVLGPGDLVRFTLDAPPLNLLGLDVERRKRPWR